jgi:hypothetical protein
MEKRNKTESVLSEEGREGSSSEKLSALSPLEEEYVMSLSDLEKSTMKIAEEHLKTSFSLKKSIGYLKWLSQNSKK